MNARSEIVRAHEIAPLIRWIRDRRVILDSDLAMLYRVQTRALVQAVKHFAHSTATTPDIKFARRHGFGGP